MTKKTKPPEVDYTPKRPRITVDDDLHVALAERCKGKKRNHYSRLANQLIREAMIARKMISDELKGLSDD
jgi:hypothetical protein